jgi:hypothetical protein
MLYWLERGVFFGNRKRKAKSTKPKTKKSCHGSPDIYYCAA